MSKSSTKSRSLGWALSAVNSPWKNPSGGLYAGYGSYLTGCTASAGWSAALGAQQDWDRINRFIKSSSAYRSYATCPFCRKEMGIDSLRTHVVIEHVDKSLWHTSLEQPENCKHTMQCVCGEIATENSFVECLDALVEHARMNTEQHHMALMLGATITGKVEHDATIQASQPAH